MSLRGASRNERRSNLLIKLLNTLRDRLIVPPRAGSRQRAGRDRVLRKHCGIGLYINIAGSSNGRTNTSGVLDLGSSPNPAAITC